MKADLVAEETGRARAERRTERTIDGGEGRTDDRQPRFRCDTTAADELDGNAESFHLLGDLQSGTVNDADVVVRIGKLQDQVGRLVRHCTAALEHDAAHDRYSALMRT
jgi:hypothetical protein